MYTIINNKEIEIKNCYSFFDRLIGNMFKKNITEGLLFEQCNSIHTFFMKNEIDVLLLDNNNKVLYKYESLKKNKIILPKKDVKKVLELPKNSIKNININKKISIYQ